MKLTAGQIAGLTGGRLVGSASSVAAYAANDHRTMVAPGALFCALRGVNADGHSYLPDAARKGASVALVEANRLDSLCVDREGMALVGVPDVHAALWILATFCRDQYHGPVVATTGSAGKTTTKSMLRSILNGSLGQGLTTHGNYNNLLGVPLTLVSLDDDHPFANLELGTSAPGEIPRLAALAKPSVAVITAVLEAHLLGLGSLEGVLREKAALGHAAGRQGVVVVPSYDSLLFSHEFEAKRVTFGYRPEDDCCIVSEEETTEGCKGLLRVCGHEIPIALPVPGTFNLRNAAAATLASVQMGVDPVQAVQKLACFQPESMRMQQMNLMGAAWILDAYNANPGSMEVALRALAGRTANGQKIAVLGAMYELGETSDALHARIGALARALGLRLVAVGKGADKYFAGPAVDGVFIESLPEAATWLTQNVRPGDAVLMKGSRSARVETILNALRSEGN